MKIHLSVIKDTLDSLSFSGVYKDKPYILRCCYSQICTAAPKELKEEIIYILPSDLLLEPALLEKGSYSFIFLDTPPEIYMSGLCNILYTQYTVDPVLLQNQIQEIFYQYFKWEWDTMNAGTSGASIQEIAELAIPFLNNPVFCQGSGFRAIFHIGPHFSVRPPEHYRNYLKEYGSCEPGTFIPQEDINTLIADPDYAVRINDPEPFIYGGQPYGYRSLCCNAYINGTIAARLCLNEILAPITDKDFAVMQILSDLIGKLMYKQDIYQYNRPKDLDMVLKDLLRHHFVQEDRILSVLQAYNWNVNDNYLCFCIKIKSKNDTKDILYSLAMRLSDFLCSDCNTILDDEIVFIVNLSFIKMKKEQLLHHILPILRDNLMAAGISTEFTDFKELYYYYRQASTAIAIGQKKNPDFWYFHFDTYNFDYLIEQCLKRMIPSALVPEGLKKLLTYDRENHSNYGETLEIYLQNDRNIADTSRALYIHRNSLVYRLSRIRAISGLDLEDYDTRLLLMFSFKLLRYHSSPPASR